jgi:hypothetical protein
MRDIARMAETTINPPPNDAQRIYARIAELIAKTPYTEREVSIHATGKPDVLRDMKRGRMPKGTRLDDVARFLRVTIDDLIPREGRLPLPPGVQDMMPGFRGAEFPRDVPVYGWALGADLVVQENSEPVAVEQHVLSYHETITYVRRVPALAGNQRAYSLYLVGSSMFPRYDNGDPIYVDPLRPARPGDDVIVQLATRLDEGREIVSALLKTLVRQNSQYVELRQYNPDMTFRLPAAQVAEVHRVLTRAELAGN